jgi:hypothetical protein
MRARRARQPLAWLKTEHAYPSREALLLQKRELEDVLIGHGYISQDLLTEARKSMAENTDLGEHLVAAGVLTDQELLSALSLQSGVPLVQVDHRTVKPRMTRTLPAHIERRFGIVPFGVNSGRLLVATQRVPAPEALNEINSYTRLLIEPQLVTKENYQALRNVMYS